MHTLPLATLPLTRGAKREAALEDPSELEPACEEPEAPLPSASGLFRCPMAANAVKLAASLRIWAALSCWIYEVK